jgi:hypothetical protein
MEFGYIITIYGYSQHFLSAGANETLTSVAPILIEKPRCFPASGGAAGYVSPLLIRISL